MNVRTTFVLLLLVGIAGLLVAGPTLFSRFSPVSAKTQGESSPTLQFLNSLAPSNVRRITIQPNGATVELKKGDKGEWSLPGDWPARSREVDELVSLLTNLRSRFSPVRLDSSDELANYNLAKPALTVSIDAGGGEHRLAFGEEGHESNRFSRATYVRLDEEMEVVRLAPGFIAALDRPADYYQQRRLFPSERVAKESDSQEKVERLTARAVAVKDPKASYSMEQAGDEWRLHEPVQDHVDPDKLNTILAAVADVWAEQFVDKPKTDLAEYGLKNPDQVLSVTGPGGQNIKLLIGKQSQTKAHKITRPAPNLGGPPLPPQQEIVHEEYRFAKLDGNRQIFEIKADKLKDIFVPADTVRDARLARFRTEDGRRLEIVRAGNTISLAKDKDRWKLEKPINADAEISKITELLDKLSGLQSRDKDVLDNADAKAYGFDKPAATVRLTVEEENKKDSKKKIKAFAFEVGKHDKEHAKVYVHVAGVPRIDAVEDSVLKLIERPALVYRGRRLFDYASTDLGKIEVKRPGGGYTIEQAKGSWRLTAPAQADVDSSKVSQLAGDLSQLEVVAYVAETASADVLEKSYGLAKPAVTAQITFADAKKPPQVLQLGKQRQGKDEYFAKLASAPSIFVVKKELRDALDQDSLALRPLQLWQMATEDIKELSIQKEGPEYHLRREGQNWRVSGPFDAAALSDTVKPMVEEIANPRCERYVAHDAKDPVLYGLDKPYLRVRLNEQSKIKEAVAASKDKTAKTAPKERIILIGKPTDKDPKTRFAKLGDARAVFVVGDKLLNAADHNALDLLNRDLLALDTTLIQRITTRSAAAPVLALQRQENRWQVVDSPAGSFPADTTNIAGLLGIFSNLRASRFVAYGAKVDPAPYGLDKPSLIVAVTLKPASSGAKRAKAVEHVLAIGNAVAASSSDRYARLDGGPGIVVLPGTVTDELHKTYLHFVNHTLLQFDAAKVTDIERQMGNQTIHLLRRDAGWRLTTPAELEADQPTVNSLVEKLAVLRAQRVVEYPAKDLKRFGLDKPSAIFTIRVSDQTGKPVEHVLKVHVTPYVAQVDNSGSVVELPQALGKELLADSLYFRNRDLVRIAGVDRAVLERGPRKATYAKVDGTWKLMQPVEADAEQAELDDWISAASCLRADGLVTEKAADLKQYGLQPPLAVWKIYVGDKQVLDLEIGGLEKTKKGAKSERRYARLGTDNLVFLLGGSLTSKALAEYRSRNVWPSLDASQIDKLSYGYPQNPFILEKVNNDWHVADKPDTKLKADAVRDTLDALAGLKAARYVVDKGADLKLYGLEPAQCVLEIQTASGKRVLHIGRPEGESKHLYATVPDSPTPGVVFVISEADVPRISRPLRAFTDMAK